MDLLTFQMELVRELLTIQEEQEPPEQPQGEQDGEGEQEEEEEQEEEHMAEQSEEEEEIEVPGEPEYIAFVPPAPRKDPISRLRGGLQLHELDVLPATQNKLYPTRVCRVCKRRDSRRKETRYYCVKCGMALCVVGCFKIYHTIRSYKTF